MALEQDLIDFKYEVEKLINDLKGRIEALESKVGK